MKDAWHGAERENQAPEASISALPPGLLSWSSHLCLSEGPLVLGLVASYPVLVSWDHKPWFSPWSILQPV